MVENRVFDDEHVSEMLAQQAQRDPFLVRMRDKWQYPLFITSLVFALVAWGFLPSQPTTSSPEQIRKEFKQENWKYCRWGVSKVREDYAARNIEFPKELELIDAVSAYKLAMEADEYQKDNELFGASKTIRAVREQYSKELDFEEEIYLRSLEADIQRQLRHFSEEEPLLASCVADVFPATLVRPPKHTVGYDDNIPMRAEEGDPDSPFRLSKYEKIFLIHRYGDSLKENHRYTDALQQFFHFLHKNGMISDNVRNGTMMKIAELLEELGKREKNDLYMRRAADYYARVADVEPKEIRGFEARERQAEILFRLKDYDKAEAALKLAREGDRTEARACLFLGWLRLMHNDNKQAMNLFLHCAEKDRDQPTFPAAKLEIIKLYQHLALTAKDKETAERFWVQSQDVLFGLKDIEPDRFKDNPYFESKDFYNTFERLAEYQKQGKAYEKAVEVYKHVMEKYAVEEGKYRLSIALSYVQMLNDPGLKLTPNQKRDALIAIGDNYMRMVEIGYEPRYKQERHMEAANSYFEAEKYSSAMLAFRSYVRAYDIGKYSPKIGEAYYKAAVSYNKLGDIYHAINMLDANISRASFAKQEKHGFIYIYESELLRAQLYCKLAEEAATQKEKFDFLDKAQADLRDIMARAPSDITSVVENAKFMSGEVYFRKAEYKKAADYLMEAQNYVPFRVLQAKSTGELQTPHEKFIRIKYIDSFRLIGRALSLMPDPDFPLAREQLEKYINLFGLEYGTSFRKNDALSAKISEAYEWLGDAYAMEADNSAGVQRTKLLNMAAKTYDTSVKDVHYYPDFPYLKEKLCIILWELGNKLQGDRAYESAIESWTTLEKTYPENAENYKRIRNEMDRAYQLKKQLGDTEFNKWMRSPEIWRRQIRSIN